MLLSAKDLSRNVEAGPPPTEVRRFEATDFIHPSSEERIALVRALKVSYVDVVSFWNAASAAVDLDVPARCEPLSKDDAVNAIEIRLRGLRRPFVFDLRSPFIAAQLMELDWWYFMVLIETSREYIVFRWMTSA